jgi:ethanolamine transporter EutH
LSAHEILIAVMAVFALLGAIDRIFGNKIGIVECSTANGTAGQENRL